MAKNEACSYKCCRINTIAVNHGNFQARGRESDGTTCEYLKHNLAEFLEKQSS